MSKKGDAVTVLTPAMVCIGPYKERGCGCLLYWRQHDYDICDNRNLLDAESAILRRLVGVDVTYWGDEGRLSPEKLAKARNRATALLGFTEGNPEAAWAKRNLPRFRDILKEYGIDRYKPA